MAHESQHVRRRCSSATFEAIERGDKTFEIFSGSDLEFEPGDMITLEEWDSNAQAYTGRRLTRKVSHVFNSKRAGISEEELNKHGLTVCGTVHPDLNSLRSILNYHFIAAIIVETKESEHPQVLTGPFYVPPMSSPEAYELGLFDSLAMESWPIGIYDVVILVFPDQKRDMFRITDQVVSGAVYVEKEDGTRGIESVELDVSALKTGKVRHPNGKPLQLADPAEVRAINSVDEVVDHHPVFQLKDSLSVNVEDELDQMLGAPVEDEDAYRP